MGACLLPHHPPVPAAHSASATGSKCSVGLQAHRAPCVWGDRRMRPWPAPHSSPRRSSSGTGVVVGHRYSRFFQTISLKGKLCYQLLQLYVLSPQPLNLLLRSVPHHVAGQSLLPSLHELLRPRIVGVGLDPLTPAQVTHCDLPPESLQHDADLFSSGVYLRRLAAFTVRTKDLVSSVRSSAATALAVSVWDIIAPLYEVLYLIQGAHPTSTLSAFSARSSVPLSLTTYTCCQRTHRTRPQAEDTGDARIAQLQERLRGAEALLEERARRLEEAELRIQRKRLDHEAEVERLMRVLPPPAVVEGLVRQEPEP